MVRSRRGRYDPVSVTDLRPRTLPASPARRRRAVATPVLGTVVAVALLVVVLLSGTAPASARPLQDGTTETSVDGAPTSDPQTTATTAAPGADLDPVIGEDVTTPADGEGETASSRRVADENRKIWVVVAGLVAVAVLLSLLTIRYWHQTRPSRVAALAAPAPAGRRVRQEPAAAPGRRSRRAVAGADHAAADEAWEPRGTGEHDRVEVPTSERRPRPDRRQRAAAFAARRAR